MTIANHSPHVLLSSPLMHQFGDEVQTHLKTLGMAIPHYKMEVTTFANGEVLPRIPGNVRGQHIFFLHALQHPNPNTALMAMFVANDALKRASAASITLVIPYIPYLRQDRMDKTRAPISARMLADLIEANRKVEHIITMDMHAEQEQGFFSIPVDNLTGVKVFAPYILQKFGDKMDVVEMKSPDAGGVVRNGRMAAALGGIPVSAFRKRRTGPNQAEIESTEGASVAGKILVTFEDMIDTGGTVAAYIKEVRNMGAREAELCATHAIFSNNALKMFADEGIHVAVTDSIPRSDDFYKEHPWITKVSITQYFAEAMYEAAQVGGSISKLSQ